MAQFNWNSVVEAAVGVSSDWSNTVKTTRTEKEETKKQGIKTTIVIVSVICLTVIIISIIGKK